MPPKFKTSHSVRIEVTFLIDKVIHCIVLQHQEASEDQVTDVPCQYHFCICL